MEGGKYCITEKFQKKIVSYWNGGLHILIFNDGCRMMNFGSVCSSGK